MNHDLAANAVRAFPHVGGQTIRFKAEPAKLTQLAVRVMCAVGTFSTERRPVRSSSGHLFGVMAALLVAGTLVLAADARPVDRMARLAGPELAVSDRMFALGVAEYFGEVARPADAAETLDAQDRFEIARLFRRTAEAAQSLAPAAGPAARRAAR